jgi:hypothetical protein
LDCTGFFGFFRFSGGSFRAGWTAGKIWNRRTGKLRIWCLGYLLLAINQLRTISPKSFNCNLGKYANERLRLGNCCFTGAGFLRWPYDHGKTPACHAAAGREEMDRRRESSVRLFASAAAWDFFNIFGLRVASVWKRSYILRSILFYDT